MQKNQFWQANNKDLHESPDYCHSSATRGGGAESRGRLTSGGIFKRSAPIDLLVLGNFNCDIRIPRPQKHGKRCVPNKNRPLAKF